MARDIHQIRIDSILGGIAPTTHFSAEDQFRSCFGIDPARYYAENDMGLVSGLIQPAGYTDVNVELNNAPMWIKTAPKVVTTFFYDKNGSAYTMTGNDIFSGGLSDGGSLDNSSGNGMEYYDNYMYFAKNTTIARYGPLDGTPEFNGSYWDTTLGKTPLTNTTYPYPGSLSLAGTLPNHILHRHSNGKLYILDVVGNQGYLHYISTTKTTVEGDTDNGSKYLALDFGYGLWPTAIESYGDLLVVALYEGSASSIAGVRQGTSKLAFWDTVSENYNSIIFVEFPDALITGMKNINGTLYIVSGNNYSNGFRVTRYIGGNSFEEVQYFERGLSPFPGALDGNSERLVFGSNSSWGYGSARGCVYSLGLKKRSLGNGLFVTGAATTVNSSIVSSLKLRQPYDLGNTPIIGWTTGTNQGAISKPGNGNSSLRYWESRLYNIGQPFRITKIRIPCPLPVSSSNTSIGFEVQTDLREEAISYATSYTLATINLTNDPYKFNIIRRSDTSGRPIIGNNCFYLKMTWNGTDMFALGLPITIEYELLDD